jgi:hypothetical protein
MYELWVLESFQILIVWHNDTFGKMGIGWKLIMQLNQD